MNKDDGYTYPRDEAAETARQRILTETEAQALSKNLDEVDLREQLKALTEKVDALDAIVADHIDGISSWTHDVSARFEQQQAETDQLLAAINEVEARVNLIPVTPDLIAGALEDANEGHSNELIESVSQFILEHKLNLVPAPYEAGDYPTLLVHAALRQAERGLIQYHQNMPPSLGNLVPAQEMLQIIRNTLPGDVES